MNPSRMILGAYWLALALSTHWPRLGLPQAGSLGYDKLIHMAAFGGLAWLICRAGVRPLLAIGMAAVYAYADELTQPLAIFGRVFSVLDLFANLMGVWLVMMLVRAGDATSRARMSLAMWLPMAAVVLLMPRSGFDVPDWLQYWIDHNLPLGPRTGDLLEPRLDRILHLLGAMVLTWWLAASRPFGRGHAHLARGFAITFVLLLAPIVEMAQERSGRGKMEIADIVSHELGLLLAIIIGAAYLLSQRQAKIEEQRHGEPLTPAATPAATAPQLTPDTEAGSAAPSRFVGDARTVSLLTLASRFTGLMRDAINSRSFGLKAVADALTFGFQIPNLFRRLFGEGALTAAFLPVYSDLLKKDAEVARRFASLTFFTLAAVLGVLTIVGEGILWALWRRAESPDMELSYRLAMIMLPYMPLVCLVAMFGTVLQVRGRFAPSAAQPILLNMVMSAAMIWSTWGVSGEDNLRRVVPIVAWSVIVAGVWQCISQGAMMLRHEKLTLTFEGAGEPFRAMLRAMLPTFIALSVFQVNTFIDTLLAVFLSPKADGPDKLILWGIETAFPIAQGGAAAFSRAMLLYQFPLGVFGIAIATAVFPALAQAAAEGNDASRARFRTILQHGLRLTVFIGLPASVGVFLVRLPACRVYAEGGEATLQDSIRVAHILAGFAPAIWAYSMNHVLTRAFYAVKDTRTPMVVSLLMVALNFLLNITLVWSLGLFGMALASTFCAIVQCLVLLRAVRGHVRDPLDASVVRSWMRTTGLTLLMTAALVPVIWLYDPAKLTRMQSAMQLAAMVVIGAAVFGLGAYITRAEELRWLLKRSAKV